MLASVTPSSSSETALVGKCSVVADTLRAAGTAGSLRIGDTLAPARTGDTGTLAPEAALLLPLLVALAVAVAALCVCAVALVTLLAADACAAAAATTCACSAAACSGCGDVGGGGRQPGTDATVAPGTDSDDVLVRREGTGTGGGVALKGTGGCV
jgi:hypothetical protein